jgi:hypothetical protein
MMFPRQQQIYTLESLRYQFIANMTAIYDTAEVSALVGHLVLDNVKPEHYNKRRAAWSIAEINDVPRPMPDQVMVMRRELESYRDHHIVKSMRRGLSERRRVAGGAKRS